MSEKIIQIISEVNRMNDLIMFSEGKEVLNESIASALKSLRTLIRNGISDITRYDIKEVDNLAKSMMKAKTTDEFFDLLNDIQVYDVEIAKQLRRDIFDILPKSTQNKIRQIVTQIENNIDSIPENKLDVLLKDSIEDAFPSEPESVRSYLKDTLSDSSETISTKRSADSVIKRINDIKNLDDLLMTDEAIRAAFKSENHWSNNMFTRLFVDNRRDATRALQAYKIDDATKSILKGKTEKEIRELVKKEIKENLDGNEELMNIIKDKSAVARWSRLPISVKASIASVIFLGGTRWVVAIGGLALLLRNKSLEGSKLVEEAAEEWTKELQTIEEGLFAKLNQDQGEKILKTLHKYDNSLPSEIFNSHGNLVEDKYMINYSTNNDKIEILDISNNYSIVKTYTTDEINELIKDNQ